MHSKLRALTIIHVAIFLNSSSHDQSTRRVYYFLFLLFFIIFLNKSTSQIDNASLALICNLNFPFWLMLGIIMQTLFFGLSSRVPFGSVYCSDLQNHLVVIWDAIIDHLCNNITEIFQRKKNTTKREDSLILLFPLLPLHV